MGLKDKCMNFIDQQGHKQEVSLFFGAGPLDNLKTKAVTSCFSIAKGMISVSEAKVYTAWPEARTHEWSMYCRGKPLAYGKPNKQRLEAIIYIFTDFLGDKRAQQMLERLEARLNEHYSEHLFRSRVRVFDPNKHEKVKMNGRNIEKIIADSKASPLGWSEPKGKGKGKVRE